MQILIVGGGLVGSTLAEKLSRVGHDVSLIDANHARVRELSEVLDAEVIGGNGATAPLLRRISGRVVGPSKNPIPWALVEIPELKRSTRTDGEGIFSMIGLKSGNPTRIRVTAKGRSYNARMENVGSLEKPAEIPIHFKEN